MRKIILAALLLLLAPLAAKAQVYPAPPNVGLAANRPVNCVASNPGQPLEPQWYFATDTSVLSICTATNTWGTTTGGGGGGGVGGGGTAGNFTEWLNANTLQNAPMLDLSGVTESSNPTVINGALLFPCTNSASGTTNGLLVALDAAGNCINLPNGQTGLIEGVMFSGGGTSGTGFEAKLGPTPITFDNQSAINDYVVAGANSEAHDAGSLYPTGVQVIGVVKSANAGPGTSSTVEISILNTLNPQGPTGHVIQVNGVVTAGATDNLNSTTPAAQANNQNLTFQTDNATPTSNVSVEAPDATASQPGFLELATDLGGTYTSPNVIGIQGIPCTLSGTPVAGQVWGFTASNACGNLYLGVAIRTVSTNSDAILSTDRTRSVRYTASSGATAVTLPQAGSSGFTANFTFLVTNAQGSGTATITPATSTINGAANLAVAAGSYCFVYSDNTNYYANCGTTNGAGGVTSVSGTAPIASSGGATPAISCSTCVTENTGGAIPTSAHILGSSSAPNLQAATRTDIDAISYVAGAGTANAQTATLSPAIASLANGLTVCWKPTAANSTTTPTLAVNGLAATTIVKMGGAALVASDLTTTAVACAIYDGTNFELQNPQTAPAGSVTQSVPPELLVNGSSSATSNTLTITKSNESPNTVWAGPVSSGSSNLVQSNSGVSAGHGALGVSFTSNTTVGDLLIVIATGDLGITSTGGNTYTQAIGLNQGTTLHMYYTCNAVGGAETVNASLAWSIQVYEFNGNATSSCADATGSSANTLSTTSISQASGSVAQATELVFSMLNVNGGSVTTVAVGPGFSRLVLSNPNTNNYTVAGLGTATTGLSGAQTATFTTNSGTGNYMVGIETFKLTATGTSQPTFRALVNGDFPAHTPSPTFRSTSASQTSAIGDTAMVVVGASAQLYRFTGTINCTTTSAAAVASLNLKYTDTSNTAQTVTISDTCTSLVTTGVPNEVVGLRVKAGTTITYGVTITNTPTYDVDVFLEQMN